MKAQYGDIRIVNISRQRLKDIELQRWLSEINNDTRKDYRRWGGGGRTRANLFLFGPTDPKISALTNFFWAHFPVAHEATREG